MCPIHRHILTLDTPFMTDATTDKPNGTTAFVAPMRELRKPERRHKPTLPRRGDWTEALKAKATRSKIANGRGYLPSIDGRSSTARRYRDIASAIVQDLGGMSQCSATTIEVVRRFAAISVLAEGMESRLVNGEEISSAELCLLSSTLMRLAHKIGLRRIPKSIQSATLADYFAQAEQPLDDDEAS
jgi:hypothetical protein